MTWLKNLVRRRKFTKPRDYYVTEVTKTAKPVPVSRSEKPLVLFSTLWQELGDGWAIASRAYARAMELAGVDVRLKTWWPSQTIHPDVAAEVGHLNRPTNQWDLLLFSCVLGRFQDMQHVFSSLMRSDGKRAFYTMFERRNLEPALIESMKRLDAVLVPCSFNHEILSVHGVASVWIPIPYFDNDPHLRLPTPHGSRRFYWIGRVEPRKAPHNLVKAFTTAFKPGEAYLTLKAKALSKKSDYPTIHQMIQSEFGKNGWSSNNWKRSITVIEEKLSISQMLEIHAKNEVYVSASRGEGFDLPSFQAKLSGRRVITTASGGPEDFVDENDLLVPATGLCLADPLYRWQPGAQYVDYNVEELVVAFQRAASMPPSVQRGVNGKFAAKSVGKALREWIGQVLK